MRLILFILFISVSCFAQTSATFEVVVKDPSGALINKAQVQLIKNGKSTRRSRLTKKVKRGLIN